MMRMLILLIKYGGKVKRFLGLQVTILKGGRICCYHQCIIMVLIMVFHVYYFDNVIQSYPDLPCSLGEVEMRGMSGETVNRGKIVIDLNKIRLYWGKEKGTVNRGTTVYNFHAGMVLFYRIIGCYRLINKTH